MAQARQARQQGLHHQRKNYEGAQAEHGIGGLLHGTEEGGEEFLRRRQREAEIHPGTVSFLQEHPHQKGRENMEQIQNHPCPKAPEAAQTHHTQDEGGAGIVAEGQQALRLRLGQRPRPEQLPHGAPAHRITAQKAQKQGRCSGAAHAEQPLRHRRQTAAYAAGKAQRGEQSRHHKIGKQRRDH